MRLLDHAEPVRHFAAKAGNPRGRGEPVFVCGRTVPVGTFRLRLGAAR